jgi:hypothetical protein
MNKLLSYSQAITAIRQSPKLQRLRRVYLDGHHYTCLEPGHQVASDGFALVWLEHQCPDRPGTPLRLRGLVLEEVPA